jgi:RsiW-degrading membrane proteinase PrsW (M82 family)
MTLAISAVGALLPSLLLLWYFYQSDRNPEPRDVLLKTFFLGVLIVVPIIAVTLPVMLLVPLPANPLLFALFVGFVCAAIPEELFKFLVVTRYSARNPAFDEPMDGVVYGVAASLGFATLENILYVAGGGWHVALTRAFSAVPMHAFLGAILGYYVGQARFNPAARVSVWRGLVTAIVFHGLYDFALLAARQIISQGRWEVEEPPPDQVMLVLGLFGLALVVLVTAGVWTWRIVHKLRQEQLAAPTPSSAEKER